LTAYPLISSSFPSLSGSTDVGQMDLIAMDVVSLGNVPQKQSISSRNTEWNML